MTVLHAVLIDHPQIAMSAATGGVPMVAPTLSGLTSAPAPLDSTCRPMDTPALVSSLRVQQLLCAIGYELDSIVSLS